MEAALAVLDDGMTSVEYADYNGRPVKAVVNTKKLMKTSTARLIARISTIKDAAQGDALCAMFELFDVIFVDGNAVLSQLDDEGDPDVAVSIQFLTDVLEAVGGKNS
jgi:hypothetical protein